MMINWMLFFSGMFFPMLLILALVAKEIQRKKNMLSVIKNLHEKDISFSKEEEKSFIEELSLYSSQQEMNVAYEAFLAWHQR